MIQRRDDVVTLDDPHTGVEHGDTEEYVLHAEEDGHVPVLSPHILPLQMIKISHCLLFSFIPIFPNNWDQQPIQTMDQSLVKHFDPSAGVVFGRQSEEAINSDALINHHKDHVYYGEDQK